jgi:hypothetical protein
MLFTKQERNEASLRMYSLYGNMRNERSFVMEKQSEEREENN